MPEPRFYWVRHSAAHLWHQIPAAQVAIQRGYPVARGDALCGALCRTHPGPWWHAAGSAPPGLRCGRCERLHPTLEGTPGA